MSPCVLKRSGGQAPFACMLLYCSPISHDARASHGSDQPRRPHRLVPLDPAPRPIRADKMFAIQARMASIARSIDGLMGTMRSWQAHRIAPSRCGGRWSPRRGPRGAREPGETPRMMTAAGAAAGFGLLRSALDSAGSGPRPVCGGHRLAACDRNHRDRFLRPRLWGWRRSHEPANPTPAKSCVVL